MSIRSWLRSAKVLSIHEHTWFPPPPITLGGEIFLDLNYLGVIAPNFFHLGGKSNLGGTDPYLEASLCGRSGTSTYTISLKFSPAAGYVSRLFPVLSLLSIDHGAETSNAWSLVYPKS